MQSEAIISRRNLKHFCLNNLKLKTVLNIFVKFYLYSHHLSVNTFVAAKMVKSLDLLRIKGLEFFWRDVFI